MEVKRPMVVQSTSDSLALFDTLVQIEVGPTKTVFQMHKGLLCNVSAYFKAALEGGFIEAQPQKIEMPDEDPQMFKRFQFWLYTRKPFDNTIQGGDSILGSDLVDIYIFAEARGIPSLQNAAIDIFIDRRYERIFIPYPYLHKVYDKTSEDSPLRKLAVAMYTDGSINLRNSGAMSTEMMKHYPSEFLRDIICAQYTRFAAFKGVPKDLRGFREEFHVPVAKDSGSQPKAGEV